MSFVDGMTKFWMTYVEDEVYYQQEEVKEGRALEELVDALIPGVGGG